MHPLLIFLPLLASYVAADEKCVVEAPFYIRGNVSANNHNEWKNGGWSADGMIISTHEYIFEHSCVEKCRQEAACGYAVYILLGGQCWLHRSDGNGIVHTQSEAIQGKLFWKMPEGECSKAAFSKSLEKWAWLKYSSMDRAVRIHVHDNDPTVYVMEFRPIKNIDK